MIEAVDHGFSPHWHFDVLEDREKQIKEGKFKFSSIDDVKDRLRKTINEN